MAKELALNIVVRTVDEASKVIRQIKREAVSATTGGASQAAAKATSAAWLQSTERQRLLFSETAKFNERVRAMGKAHSDEQVRNNRRVEASENALAATRRANAQIHRFQMMDVAMTMRAVSTEAFIVGGAMTAVGVGIARTSLEVGGILARFEAGTATILGNAERAKRLGAEVRQFIVRSPFKTSEGVEAARRGIAAGFNPDTLVRDMTSIGNIVGGTGGNETTFSNITKELGKLNNQQVLYQRNMTRLVNNSVPAWRLLQAGMQARGLKVTNEQLGTMVERRLIPAKQAIQDILKGADVLFPGMMSKMLDVDPLAQWAVTFDHLILTITDLTAPLRSWLLSTLKAINTLMAAMPQNMKGIIPVLFSLGVASNIVFGGMLLGLSGILFMGNMVLLMFAAWPSLMQQIGLPTSATMGEALSRSKRIANVAWKRQIRPALVGPIGSKQASARMPNPFFLKGTLAERAGFAGAEAGRMGQGWAGLRGGLSWFDRLRRPAGISRGASKWLGTLGFDSAFNMSQMGQRAALERQMKVDWVQSLFGKGKAASTLGGFAKIASHASRIAMIAALVMGIVSNWDKFGRLLQATLKTLGLALIVVTAIKVASFLAAKGLFGGVVQFILMNIILNEVVKRWDKIVAFATKYRAVLEPVLVLLTAIYTVAKLMAAVSMVKGIWAVLGSKNLVLIAALVGFYLGQWSLRILDMNSALARTLTLILAIAGVILLARGFMSGNIPAMAMGAAMGAAAIGRSAGTEPEHRAGGGPVRRGRPYLVGENGPELFMPSASGRIVSTPSLLSTMSGVATTAISAQMPSVRNPGISTLFPFLSGPGYGNATRMFNGSGSTDIYTEEDGDEIVIRVKRNSFGDITAASRGMVFR